MQKILLQIISDNQRAFKEKILITDNTIIVYEVFNNIKKVIKRKRAYVGIKMDMANAYDRLA